MEVAELNMLAQWPRVLHHLDQPHGDASFMPTLRVGRLAAKHVKVVLTGDGGDELFAGYDKYAQFFARLDALAYPQAAFERSYFDSISLFSPEAKAALYRRSACATCQHRQLLRRGPALVRRALAADRINQVLCLDMQLLLSGNNLVKPDRMGMAVSIEARTPFLDWRMMEFAFRSRGATKLSAEGDKKHWFKRAATPLIGEDLAHRRKQMFTVPVGDWFRHGSYEWLRETLQGSELIAQLFEPAVVAWMLERHRTGDANFTRELRALAALALWHRGVVQKKRSDAGRIMRQLPASPSTIPASRTCAAGPRCACCCTTRMCCFERQVLRCGHVLGIFRVRPQRGGPVLRDQRLPHGHAHLQPAQKRQPGQFLLARARRIYIPYLPVLAVLSSACLLSRHLSPGLCVRCEDNADEHIHRPARRPEYLRAGGGLDAGARDPFYLMTFVSLLFLGVGGSCFFAWLAVRRRRDPAFPASNCRFHGPLSFLRTTWPSGWVSWLSKLNHAYRRRIPSRACLWTGVAGFLALGCIEVILGRTGRPFG